MATSAQKLPSLRSFSDFVLDTKRYLSPPFNDIKRLNNRITSNLLYYQTNYFAVTVVSICLFFLFGAQKMIWGSLALVINVIIGLLLVENLPFAQGVKLPTPAKFPLAGLMLLFSYVYLRQILFVFLSVGVPFVFWIIHASTRSRGLKNKLSNKMEQAGAHVYASTPMGYYLAKLGFETRDFGD